MTIELDGITLPEDMEWSDEYLWDSVVQTRTFSVSGALIIQESQKQAGRPFTLYGGPDACWVTKATLDLLKAKLDTPDLEMSLNYHGTVYSVRFNREFAAIEAQSVRPIANPDDSEFYQITIHLIVV